MIMPDHVHLFLRGSHKFRLGAWIGALKQALAKAAVLSRAQGQMWEEGFFDHVLRNNESYSQKWNYVRENPVRAGLVQSVADWPYPRRDRLHRSRVICVPTGLWLVNDAWTWIERTARRAVATAPAQFYTKNFRYAVPLPSPAPN